MPINTVKTTRDDQLWNKSKEQAQSQGRAKDYPYIMGIFQRMTGEKSMLKLLDAGDVLSKAGGGPYVGPRGGLWADSQHKIPYDKTKKEQKEDHSQNVREHEADAKIGRAHV